jgi:hypothetical protein
MLACRQTRFGIAWPSGQRSYWHEAIGYRNDGGWRGSIWRNADLLMAARPYGFQERESDPTNRTVAFGRQGWYQRGVGTAPAAKGRLHEHHCTQHNSGRPSTRNTLAHNRITHYLRPGHNPQRSHRPPPRPPTLATTKAKARCRGAGNRHATSLLSVCGELGGT